MQNNCHYTIQGHSCSSILVSIKDSKPGRLFPNPGFMFGCPQTRVLGSGSGLATLKSRRQADDVYSMYQWENCVKMHL